MKKDIAVTLNTDTQFRAQLQAIASGSELINPKSRWGMLLLHLLATGSKRFESDLFPDWVPLRIRTISSDEAWRKPAFHFYKFLKNVKKCLERLAKSGE